MEKEQFIRTAFITAWLKDITQEKALEVFQMYGAKNICIGGIEKTENDLEHFHIVVSFGRTIRFSTLKNICNSFHIEPCQSKKVLEYSIKEGIFYNDYNLEPNDGDNIYTSLVNDMLLLSWKQLIRKYPKLIINNYNNIFQMYSDLNKND